MLLRRLVGLAGCSPLYPRLQKPAEVATSCVPAARTFATMWQASQSFSTAPWVVQAAAAALSSTRSLWGPTLHQAGLQRLQLPCLAAAHFMTCTALADLHPSQESSAAEPVTAEAPASSVVQVPTGGESCPLYTMRQVAKHDNDESCWIVVNGKVYDVSSYLDDHPGGSESILLNAGVDATDEFNSIHSKEAKEMLEKFLIGAVKPGKKSAAAAVAEATAAATAAAATATEPPLVQLADPRVRYSLPLVSKQQLNPDTFLLRFALASPQTRLGLPCGKHVYLFADIGGEAVARAYTPLSGDQDVGVLDLLIKVYWAGVHPQFPEGGKMTQYLANLKVGDAIEVKGPMGKFVYEGRGQYQLNRQPGQAKYISMIAGGSGITPCYAVLREILADPEDKMRCALIYANKHEEDIWCRKELEEMAAAHPDRLHLWFTLEQPPAAAAGSTTGPWRYSQGFITKDMMAQHLLPAGEGSIAAMCGPPAMLERVVIPGLTELGFKPDTEMVVF